MGEFLGERRFPWEGPLRVSVVGGSTLVMRMRCPCKHLFLGLNVMGESTVKRDCLEGVLSAKVRRWEKPLEKDLLGSIHSLREGNGRAPVKKGVSSYPVFRMDLRDSSP